MRFFVSCLCASVLACATPAAIASSDQPWCTRDFPGSPAEWSDLPGARITMVELSRLEGAVRRLRRSSIVPLTPMQARDLTGQSRPPNGRYYLIRSGIFARPNASRADYHHQAVIAARRLVFWRPQNRHLLVLTLQQGDGELQIFNVPLVVEVAMRPAAAYSVCQSLL